MVDFHMSLTKILTKTLKSCPGKKAIACNGKVFNYRQFGERVGRLSNALIKTGISRGKKVAILHKNCHYYLECYFGVMHTGAALVPLNHHLTSSELAFILKNSESELLITSDYFSDKVYDITRDIGKNLNIIKTGDEYEDLIADSPAIIPDVSSDGEDVAQLYYTSGTTGRPKGVVLSHKNVNTHAHNSIAELQLTEGDVWLHAAPLFHLADAWATWAITRVGGTHVLCREFSPDTIFDIMERERITITNMVPTMYYRLVNHPQFTRHNYSSLRVLLSGGAPISPDLVRKIIEGFKCDYIQTYGMTETSPFLTMSTLKDHLRSLPYDQQLVYKSTTGREFQGVKLKVVNEKDEEVNHNNMEVGEIIVKGDTIFKGYWKLPDETGKVFNNGWFYTGDMAVINEEGYVTIVDRRKYMIITGGENVFSIEVENIIYKHPAVLEAAVIGTPDEEWGERVTAVIVLKDGYNLTKDDIIEHCKGKISKYKIPKSVFFSERLPKLGSGKISKKRLKETYAKNE
jgi:acyl-CoA synthetase (AMP-forming)/AMP-acid ligase II